MSDMTKKEMNQKLLSLFVDWEDVSDGSGDTIHWGDGYNWYEFDFFKNPPKNIFEVIEKHKISVTHHRDFWTSESDSLISSNFDSSLAGKTYQEALAKILIKIGEEYGHI